MPYVSYNMKPIIKKAEAKYSRLLALSDNRFKFSNVFASCTAISIFSVWLNYYINFHRSSPFFYNIQ